MRRRFITQENILELVHARIGKQQRRVTMWHHGSRRNDRVPALEVRLHRRRRDALGELQDQQRGRVQGKDSARSDERGRVMLARFDEKGRRSSADVRVSCQVIPRR